MLHNSSFMIVGQQNGAVPTGGSLDKGREWQMELLMEKLRSKAASFKSLVETAKSIRSTIVVSYSNIFRISLIKLRVYFITMYTYKYFTGKTICYR